MIDNILPPTIALVLHFRHTDATIACLKSLVNEGIQRIQLVDNTDDDGHSLSKLTWYIEDLRRKNRRVSVYTANDNLGFSAGVNEGLKEIYNRFGAACVLLINNDARLAPGSHRRLRETLVKGAAMAVAEVRDSRHERIHQHFYHRATGLLLKRQLPGSYPSPNGCALMIGPKLAASRLFDEDFFFYGDDAELGWRLSENGVVVNVARGAFVEHNPSTSSINGSLFYEYQMVLAHWILAKKVSRNRVQYAMFVVGRSIVLPLRAIWRSLRHCSLRPSYAMVLATFDYATGRRRRLKPRAP